jgi:hypothetical protein
MAGGNKRMIINTRERVISPDINRAQRFIAADRAEIARREMGNVVPSVFDFAGKHELGSFLDTTIDDAAPVGTPLRGDVIEGLVVVPQPGTLNLLVQPGVVWLDDPDGQAGSSDPSPPNPDDSRFKLVVDPGIVSLGVLLAGAGGGGGIRIDVIEVQRTTTVLEVDNRDVFDPSTGTFVPVAVNKVDEGRLVYRRRAGISGAGFPANVQGWLPICVISVPNAAVNVDTMTFWDVRPLVKDRVHPPYVTANIQTAQENNIVTGNIFTAPLETRLTGTAMNRLNEYHVGGALVVGNAPWFDAQAAGNQAAGIALPAFGLYYVYAVCPFLLPRWVRYTDFPNPRLPLGPRGVLTVSQLPPLNDFLAEAIIPLPTATGLGGSGAATMLLAGATDGGNVPRPITVSGGITSLELAAPASPVAVPAGGADRYTFIPGTHFPHSARAIRVSFSWAVSGPVALPFQFNGSAVIFNPAFTAVIALVPGGTHGDFLLFGAGPFTQTVNLSLWIPRPMAGSGNGYVSDNLAIQVGGFTAAVTARVATCIISGWKLDE